MGYVSMVHFASCSLIGHFSAGSSLSDTRAQAERWVQENGEELRQRNPQWGAGEYRIRDDNTNVYLEWCQRMPADGNTGRLSVPPLRVPVQRDRIDLERQVAQKELEEARQRQNMMMGLRDRARAAALTGIALYGTPSPITKHKRYRPGWRTVLLVQVMSWATGASPFRIYRGLRNAHNS